MNSTITIEDTDDEVIDLDSSQDITNNANNDQSECFIDKNSLSNDIAKPGTTSDNAKDNKDVSTTQTYDSPNSSEPILKVMFRDESISRLYGKRIKELIEELIPSMSTCQETDDGLTLNLWDNDSDSTNQSVKLTTESEDSQNIICDTLFTIDTQPKLQNDLDVPTYGKKFENVFDNAKPESKSEPDPTFNSPKLMCFNCLDNHNLRGCPKPRDQAAINKNKRNFNMKGGNTKTLRYHLQNDQKFGHFIPGQLSNNLRKALGLRDNELPIHIYRMRMLGYPPGWLEEACLQHSGISLFNSDGNVEDNADVEPGEVFESESRDQYDIKKIHDFPGFNIPPPPGTRDDNGHYWISPMQTVHSKQTMLMMLKGKKADDGYKRKKLKTSNISSSDNPAPESTEMEIEDVEDGVVECLPVNGLFVPPLPQECTTKPPEPPEPPLPPLPPTQGSDEDLNYHTQDIQSPENSASPSSRAYSPSLCDLENMKKRLLVELQESSSQSNSDALSKSNSADSASKSEMPPPSNEETPESHRNRRSSLNSSHGSVKSIDLGTPILKTSSPYNKLPSPEKFSKNICDVINFQNLPNSTGKYEQMTGVLQKVRVQLANLQQE